MTQAVQIVARGARPQAEAAAQAIDTEIALEGATYSILEEDEDKGLWRIDAFPMSEDEENAFVRLLADFDLTVGVEPLADADWLAMSLSGLPPVRAGRFFVYGAHDQALVPPGAVSLRIEAGAAFGTGHHGTTVGCLIAFSDLLKAKRFPRVLDVGTGTGVLGVAAARTGSRLVRATEIDAPSIRIARENAVLNRASLDVRLSGALAGVGGGYHLVFANILAAPLIALSPQIRRALAPGGVVILSGLLRTQERRVAAAYRARGFRFVRRLHRDAWATLVMRRS